MDPVIQAYIKHWKSLDYDEKISYIRNHMFLIDDLISQCELLADENLAVWTHINNDNVCIRDLQDKVRELTYYVRNDEY